jgi:hypothetical protein
MKKYDLSFISNKDLFQHVKDTIVQYSFKVDLKKFNNNLIDPIKLTLDSKIYGKDIEETISAEVIRQLDKSNSNVIGYFQQNFFKYIFHKDTKKSNWIVPNEGFDVENKIDNTYIEMKNKHNTMNSKSTSATYTMMMDKVLNDSKATCMLVEVMAKNSQNIKWVVTINKKKMSNERIRRVSIDKFYELVTGEKEAFKQLVEVLPTVMDDVLEEIHQDGIVNTVFEELEKVDKNILKSLYLLSFEKYEGFNSLKISLS